MCKPPGAVRTHNQRRTLMGDDKRKDDRWSDATVEDDDDGGPMPLV